MLCSLKSDASASAPVGLAHCTSHNAHIALLRSGSSEYTEFACPSSRAEGIGWARDISCGELARLCRIRPALRTLTWPRRRCLVRNQSALMELLEQTVSGANLELTGWACWADAGLDRTWPTNNSCSNWVAAWRRGRGGPAGPGD